MNERVALVLASALLAAAPADVRAQDAGGVRAPIMVPVAGAVTASGGGLTVTARPDATAGAVASVTGTAPARRLVRVRLRNPQTGSSRIVARARAGRDGRFAAYWRPARPGRFEVRAGRATPFALTVYRRAVATWYGPGFFGHLTACGVALTPDLQGVAHRSLPCGTPVALHYGGRTILVPVVDRGPFGVAGADWDLTQAAAQSLGVTTTTTVGALPQPSR